MSVLDFVDQIHHYSVDEYVELVDLGAFEDQRVELLEGLVLDMSPPSDLHEDAIAWLVNEWAFRTADVRRNHVRINSTLRLTTSVPQPDLLLVEPRLGEGRPTRGVLAIEVALSSHRRDLVLKPRLYAPAVAEYWVIDLSAGRAVVHREAGADGYRDVSVHGRDAELRPQHAAVGPLRPAELFDAI
jgi:Uma2 family endonuclease